MTHEDVDKFEECLRNAQSSVEEAAQKMADSPTMTDASGKMWSNLHKALSIIEDCIHGAYMLRPEGGV